MFKLLSALPLNGQKTNISGVAMILLGISGLVLFFTDAKSPYAMEPNAAAATIVAGLGLLGLRHGIEKASVTLTRDGDDV